ncbi:S8 family serine peptidase [Isoptericola sp. NEAU-Y5]|uniref:S8 family serine peptidase n=1 Tax=Isoptericola luteus TaxID=2879484 RepID=A0ABS7ZI04_9MICO|nr:S8 family serine peptidase [Isoptericola sp. NEAU-Y5]MCA5894655.1 S8 family serine peptidase [Isoptericola sp. NEAU-Y5]
MRTTHRARAAAAGAVLALAVVGIGNAAVAAPEPPSTPVPVVTPEGQTFSYVVNAKHANRGHTRLVERAVEAAGGVVVQSWPQIGVVVAHSANDTFRADVVRRARGHAVASVGVTRTVPVSEGTPAVIDDVPGAEGGPFQPQKTKRVGVEVADENDVSAVPDPGEATQWDMAMIKADQAIEINPGSPDVLVGVLDSGIDVTHPDLATQVDASASVNCTGAGRPDTSATGWLPTTSDHGTHVAGTIAAADNGLGIVGVAPGVKMASIKVVNDDGYIYPEYAVCGFVWAGLHGVDVTNNSYYVDPFMYWCSDQPDQAAGKEAVRRAVAFSTRNGAVHAAAAGNAATDLANNTVDTSSPNDSTAVERTINSGCEDIPTELDGVVTVSSITSTGALSSFSNRGLGKIDVAAPGSAIVSTELNGTWDTKSGTSMASPHVAGVLALLASEHPRWSPERLERAVRQQADSTPCGTTSAGPACVGTPQENSYFGRGIVDALDAVTLR